ncbi:MAG TPA: hypothetical protein PLH65_02360 [bacterium]|nr:hypothetical protein [bacterium]
MPTKNHKFQSNEIFFILELLTWIEKNLQPEDDRNIKNKFFRKRTAAAIIKSGFSVGCTDYAIVFQHLLQPHDIPNFYLETIHKKWLENESNQNIIGHVFIKVIINNKELYIDPTFGCIYISLASTPYIIALESTNFPSSGLTNLKLLQKFCINFKKNWQKKNKTDKNNNCHTRKE